MKNLPLGRIVQGDALEVLRGWPAGCVQTCVTSPPYWGLRDYGLEDTGKQIGLERTPEEHVARLVEVFREVRRVLRDDGTLWLNYGDAYAAGAKGGPWDESRAHSKSVAPGVNYSQQANRRPLNGLKPKDLIGLPWMVAFALRADGWWLREDIIWAKGVSFCPTWAGSVMPESVRDRPTRSHEYLFLLTKAARYFYDAEAVREVGTGRPSGNTEAKLGDEYDRPGHHRAQSFPWDGGNGARNLRSVWVINPQPYKGAHFATFPEALVEPCIKAGTSERGACAACGAPWVRQVEVDYQAAGGRAENEKYSASMSDGSHGGPQSMKHGRANKVTQTTGWAASCGCAATSPPGPLSVCGEGEKLQPVPCVVMDPFAGSGTVGMVAARLGRGFVGIDLAGGDKDLGGHTAHDRIRGAREGRGTEAAAFARVNGQTEIPVEAD